MTTDEPAGRALAFCNYEGSEYRTDFWEGKGRDYEDRAERIALRAMIPPGGERIVDLGAGFGRLADLYDGYQQVVLLDYSRSLLEEARQRLGDDPRFVFVAGNLYKLPFAEGALDAAVMVRVIHHLAEPGAGVREIGRVLADGRFLILEYANKRNIKAILRYWLRRQAHDPFSREPWEFVPLNFDFHPCHIGGLLEEAGLVRRAQRAVSGFRIGWLKRMFPATILAALDGALQVPTGPLALTPSVFVQAERPGVAQPLNPSLFRCPECGSAELDEREAALVCGSCGRRWSRQGGIYDFREPVNGAEDA